MTNFFPIWQIPFCFFLGSFKVKLGYFWEENNTRGCFKHFPYIYLLKILEKLKFITLWNFGRLRLRLRLMLFTHTQLPHTDEFQPILEKRFGLRLCFPQNMLKYYCFSAINKETNVNLSVVYFFLSNTAINQHNPAKMSLAPEKHCQRLTEPWTITISVWARMLKIAPHLILVLMTSFCRIFVISAATKTKTQIHLINRLTLDNECERLIKLKGYSKNNAVRNHFIITITLIIKILIIRQGIGNSIDKCRLGNPLWHFLWRHSFWRHFSHFERLHHIEHRNGQSQSVKRLTGSCIS